MAIMANKKWRMSMLGSLLAVVLAMTAGCGANPSVSDTTGTQNSAASKSDGKSDDNGSDSSEDSSDASSNASSDDASSDDSNGADRASDDTAGTTKKETGSGQNASASGQAAVTADMINIKDSDYETDWESENPVTIDCSGSSAAAEGSGKGVEISDGQIWVVEEGTYVLTGNFNGTVVVDTQDDDAKVRLVLDNFSIHSSSGPAILVLTADKVTITTADGSDNNVEDGEHDTAAASDAGGDTDTDTEEDTGTNTDGKEDTSTDTDNDDTGADYDAAIYSKTDLVLNGDGTLTIEGQYKDAVHSTDDLRITGGTYVVTSVDDGFVGKDRLEITDGTFTVTTTGDGGDAFKSTNTEEDDKGFIYISGGTFRIDAGDEAFQSATALMVTGGTFTIAAGGKGFHADETLQFDGGDVAITSCCEGLEAPVIVVNGGTFDMTASDDGINAASGDEDDSSSTDTDGNGDGPGNRAQGRGWGGMESTSTGYLYINGGTIHINAAGDGIDSNTTITQTGGTITVDGPTANMDGALDYDDTYDISGGSVFAVGSAGMLQTVSDSSSVNCLAMVYTSTQQAGTTITIQDAAGSTIASFTPMKAYQSFVYASAALQDGATYTVYSDDTKLCDVTLNGTVTMVDDSGQTSSAGQRGGFGGMHHGGTF